MDVQEDNNFTLILLGVQLMNLYLQLKKRRKRWLRRRWWVRPINLRRSEQGDVNHLFQELKEDTDMFFKYTRMDVKTFYDLLNLLSPRLIKKSKRIALPPEFRLAVTLRYLATGDQVTSLALAYRIGISTCYAVVKETCAVLFDVLGPLYLRAPTEEEWKDVASTFLQKWNMPNCIGAVDGKHVQVQAPINTGSDYFNYKKTFSLVLMGICDANYKFTLIDVGVPGSNSDGSVFNSNLGEALANRRLNIPEGLPQLPGSDIAMPLFLVGDAAFQLTTNMMRPYPGRNLNFQRTVFNYRLSRARRTIENAFRILAARWRVFRQPIALSPHSTSKIVVATVCLHNYLITKKNQDDLKAPHQLYCPPTLVDQEDGNHRIIPGLWRNETSILESGNNGPHRATRSAYQQRDTLATYFLTPEGHVPWQQDYVRRGFNAEYVDT